ncbi:MAG: hypothetical protein LN364_02885 [Candidatus Thermoplasmatota archaeon]|nr:hypothetical protein [Candidatus Thermoplasmatota archaeon]
MIKKYAMIIAVLLVILMFTSTSTASFLFSEGKIYEGLPENSPLKTMLDRLYQVASNNDDDVALDVEEDDETDDEDDGEYDDEMDPDDSPEEDVRLPKIWNMVGEITPYEGNYTDEGDDENITNTIDHPDGDDDGVVWNNVTVNPDKDVNATNGLTIDEGEWTVKLERFVKIVTELDGDLGTLLQRVVERTFATGTTDSGGTVENDVVDDIVLTDGDQ